MYNSEKLSLSVTSHLSDMKNFSDYVSLFIQNTLFVMKQKSICFLPLLKISL